MILKRMFFKVDLKGIMVLMLMNAFDCFATIYSVHCAKYATEGNALMDLFFQNNQIFGLIFVKLVIVNAFILMAFYIYKKIKKNSFVIKIGLNLTIYVYTAITIMHIVYWMMHMKE